MGLLKGLLYCYLWYASIMAGYSTMFCPMLPLLFISTKWYRFMADTIGTLWMFYPTVLVEYIYGCEIQVTGDPIKADECAILIVNHRTRTDWNFLWPTFYHCVKGKNRISHHLKFLLKDTIRHIPGPGWVMQLKSCIYIKRCWEIDKKIMKNFIDYFAEIKCKCSILIFPEGTDFTKNTQEKSNKFAEKNGLQKYDYVLHPKTTGFSYFAYELMKSKHLDAIYDITLVYPDTLPQTEMSLVYGQFPRQVKVHLSRYPLEVLPKDEESLKTFLEERWRSKEKTLKEYNVTGNFLHGQILKQNKPIEMYATLIFWTCLPFLTMHLLIHWPIFRYIVILHTVFLLILNCFTNGFQEFEITVFNFKKKLLKKLKFN